MAIEIRTWEDLANVASGNDYILMNDLDETTDGYNTYASSTANSGEGWAPITYDGKKIFDGNFHIIKGLYINRPNSNEQGLFKVLLNWGEVKNLGIADCDITGQDYVGGLVGNTEVFGGIKNCFVTGEITGNDYVGGLIGVSTNNHKGGGEEWEDIDGIYNCYSTCNVEGNEYIGGFCGYNENSDFNYCYSTGSVTGNSNVKGFLGESDTILNSCYYDKETSGRSDTKGGSIPKTTEEMKQEATFVNWDFINTWRINEGISYPKLQWQISPEPIIDRKIYIGGGLGSLYIG